MSNMSLFVKLGIDMKAFEKGLNLASSKMQSFGRKMTNVGKDMTLKVSAPIGALGVLTLKTAGDFEAAMNKVQAVSGATGAEFDALKQQARDLGATTQFSATQAADAMTFLSMAGFEATEIIGAMPSTLNLAAAAQLDMGSAADIVSNIMAGFNMTTEELAGAVDVLAKQFTTSNTNLSQLGEAMKFVAPVASGLGVSIEESSAAIGILSDAGIQASMAGTGLRRILSTLAQKSDELGINVYQANGALRPMADIMEDLEKQGHSTARIMEVFGERGGPALMALLSAGSDAIREQTSVLAEAGGTAEKIADTQMKGLNGALKALRSAFEELQLAIADSGLLEDVTGFVKQITSLARRLGETNPQMLRLATVVAAAAAAIGPMLILVGQMSMGMGAATKAVGLLTKAMMLNPWLAAAVAIGLLTATVLPKLITLLTGATGEFEEVTKSVNSLETANGHLKESYDELAKVQADMEGSTAEQIELTKEEARQRIKNAEATIREAQELRRLLIEKQKQHMLAMQQSDLGGGAQVKSIQAIEKEVIRLEKAMEEAELTTFRMAAVMHNFEVGIPPAEGKLKALREQILKLSPNLDLTGKNVSELEAILKSLTKTTSTTTDDVKIASEAFTLESASISTLSNEFTKLTENMSKAISLKGSYVDKTQEFSNVVRDAAMNYAQFLLPAINQSIDALANGGVNALQAFADGLKQMIIQLVKAVAQAVILAGIMSILAPGSVAAGGGVFGIFKGIMGFANGGVPPVGRPSIVGEQGPELFVPSTRGTVIPNHMLGGGASEVTFRIEGSQLVGVLNREGKRMGRV